MIDVLTFDLFGTLYDWRGSIIRRGERLFGGNHWGAVADDWADAYSQIARRHRETGVWVNLDVSMKEAYSEIEHRYKLDGDALKSASMAEVWAYLDPFPEVTSAIHTISSRIELATLTNANVTMIRSLNKQLDPWSRFDHMLSSAMVRRFKPDPMVYQMAIEYFGGNPSSMMHVASHCFDLNAAHSHGMRTALITREGEPGSDPSGLDHKPEIVAENLTDFVDQLRNL